MKIRRLFIRIQTEDGPYGTTIDFPDGLVVLWADNTMGKSTCVKSILVALGLEAMLTTSQAELPLPPAVTKAVDDLDGSHGVIESDVFLEIVNDKSESIAVQRTIKGSRDKNLISVYLGPALTSPGAYQAKDFFVNRAGGASRELGFHQFLARFLGWSLPVVQTFDGGECPLYLQCIFPYLVVEQTRGWSTIQPPLPSQFRIRDIHRRSVEFILDMDAHRIALRRQELVQERNRLLVEWTKLVTQAGDIAKAVSGVSRGIPARPTATWPPEVRPVILLPSEDNWISAEEVLQCETNKLAVLVHQEIPRVSEITSAVELELEAAEEDLKDREVVLSRSLESLELERQEADSIRKRLETLQEDIQRNKDVQTLREMGSNRFSTISQGTCPYCHQSIQDSLVPLSRDQPVMSLDENIDFLLEQQRTFNGVLANTERVIHVRERQAQAGRRRVTSLRERIRVLRETLIADGRTPSIAAIQTRLELDSSIRSTRAAIEQFDDIVTKFEGLAIGWKGIEAEFNALPEDDATTEDKRKIDRWTSLFQEELRQYSFRSLAPESISLSHDTYRPEREGFDIPTAISASDLIRIIWASLHGMLELSREVRTNHPGVLVLDEPRQQSANRVSFGELMRRASTAGAAGQQVVIFTSEDRESLRTYLHGIEHTYREFDGRILRKLEATT